MRHTLKVEKAASGVRIRNMTGTPLEVMLFNGLISDHEFGVIDDLLADMYRCGHMGLKAVDYTKTRVKEHRGEGLTSFDALILSTNETLRRISSRLGNEHVELLYKLLNSDLQLVQSTRVASSVAMTKSVAAWLDCCAGVEHKHRLELPM